MKVKKISKKLSLKKETVMNMEEVKAGAATIAPCVAPVTRNYSQCGDGYATLVPCLCE